MQNRNNHKHDLRIINAEEKRLENAVLQAIKTEIEIMQPLFHGYKSPIDILVGLELEGRFSEKGNFNQKDLMNAVNDLAKGFNIILFDMPEPVIYHNNCSSIGKIKDENLRKEIVTFYCLLDSFKNLIFSFKEYKESVEKNLTPCIERGIPPYERLWLESPDRIIFNVISNDLSDKIDEIKNDYDELDKYFKITIETIETYLNSKIYAFRLSR